MTLHASIDRGTVGEDIDDLREFLHRLSGCPPVNHTLTLRCSGHGPDAGSWFYVEADAQECVARRRCMACGLVTPLLDSAAHWTHPPMYACTACGQSIMELAVGLHSDGGGEGALETGQVSWLALAARCVECGLIQGLTDVNVPNLTVGEVSAAT